MSVGLTRQRPGELPLEVTGFVGRQRELAELAGLLRSARLVTVTGPGGVGKTRVALRAAAQLAGEFADGACLVELSGLHDPELLPDTIATSLGLPGTEPRSQLDAIIEHLRDQRMLLILDTCEHLVDACAMLADVLLRATTVTVLATSRQPLAVPGEHTCAIAPLPVPDRRARTAGDGDAVEQVCAGGPLDREDILATLIGLVDKSVVLRAEGEGTRYLLLETIREFGAEKLADSAEQAELRDRHIARYLAMAAALADDPTAEDQLPRYRRLWTEQANLRAALDYALAAPGRQRDAARLANALSVYWQMASSPGEGRFWLGRVLGTSGRRGFSARPNSLWQLVGSRLASSATRQARHARAEQEVRDALGEERYLALRHQGAWYALADIVRFAAEGADDLPPHAGHQPPDAAPAGAATAGAPAGVRGPYRWGWRDC